MSDSIRNGLIRISLVAMLACYYVGGIVADSPHEPTQAEFAPSSDVAFDLKQRAEQLRTMEALPASGDSAKSQLRDDAKIFGLVSNRWDDSRPNETIAPDLPAATTAASHLPLLSRQIPYMYEELRLGIYGQGYATDSAFLAGRSATLALLADYSAELGSQRPEDLDLGQWQELCNRMRTAAHEVNQACHAGNQSGAVVALAKLRAACVQWELATAHVARHDSPEQTL